MLLIGILRIQSRTVKFTRVDLVRIVTTQNVDLILFEGSRNPCLFSAQQDRGAWIDKAGVLIEPTVSGLDRVGEFHEWRIKPSPS